MEDNHLLQEIRTLQSRVEELESREANRQRDLQNRLNRIQRHQSAIWEIVKHPAVNAGDMEQAFRVITERVSEVVSVERVSVWFLENEDRVLQCRNLYESTAKRHTHGMRLRAADFPHYFQALDEGRVLDAPDARTDARTVEFLDSYLVPLGIASMLDSPIRQSGRVIGVLCLEHVGEPRHWTPEETAFAAEAADQTAQTKNNYDLNQTLTALRRSEQNYREIFNSTNDAIFIHDASDGNILDVNRRALELLQCEYSDVVGRTVEAISPDEPPYSREEAMQWIRRAVSEGSQLFEWRGRRKDGELFWVEVSMSATRIGGEGRVLAVVRDVTERKCAQAEILRRKTMLQTVFRAAPIGIGFIKDRVLGWTNDSFQKLVGYSAEELEGRDTKFLYFSEEEYERVGHGVYSRFPQQKLGIIETKFRCKDGRILDFLLSLAPIDTEDDSLGLIFTVMDLTEFKKLERSRDRMFQMSLDCLCVAGLDGYFKEINPAWSHILGWSFEELMCRPWTNFVHPDDLDQTLEAGKRLQRGEPVVAFENRYRCRDGSYRWLSWNTWPVPEENVAYAVARDVTCHKETELALRESESRFRSVVQSTPMGMYLYEMDAKGELILVSANPSADRLTGIQTDQLLGKRIEEAFPALCQTEIPQRYKQAALEGTPYQIFDLSYEDASIRGFFDVYAFQTSPGKMTVMFNEVTQRRKLEDQFRQSQKMEAVGKLAGGVAHDFNNMLTVILGYCDFALTSIRNDDPLAGHLQDIKKAGERAMSLTRQLLAFSRKQILQPEVLDLNKLILDLDKMLRRLIGEDIEYITLPDPDLGRVKADPGQIEQVILNLVVNARDAMPRGGKMIIETRNVCLSGEEYRPYYEIPPGEYVLLAVSDTGVGIEKELLDKVFDPFFTTKKRGTGLGLSTVHGIVKQSGGTITVYSEIGRGSTFKIYLPRVSAEATLKKSVPEDTGSLGGHDTVFVVEDEEIVRKLIVSVLRRQGYRVLEAGYSTEALQLESTYPDVIDLLITDVVMPHMSGRELAERMVLLRPGIRVLYISGYTDNAIVHHGFLDEDVWFLQKPFTPRSLLQKVKEILQPDLRRRPE